MAPLQKKPVLLLCAHINTGQYIMANKKHKNSKKPFKWKHTLGELILWLVRWYCRYALSYRDLQEIAAERGLIVDHTTIYRWVQEYAPEINKRIKPHLKKTCDSWKAD